MPVFDWTAPNATRMLPWYPHYYQSPRFDFGWLRVGANGTSTYHVAPWHA